MTISEERWRKLLKRIQDAEKNIQMMQLLLDCQTNPRQRKTSDEKDREIQESLLRTTH